MPCEQWPLRHCLSKTLGHWIWFRARDIDTREPSSFYARFAVEAHWVRERERAPQANGFRLNSCMLRTKHWQLDTAGIRCARKNHLWINSWVRTSFKTSGRKTTTETIAQERCVSQILLRQVARALSKVHRSCSMARKLLVRSRLLWVRERGEGSQAPRFFAFTSRLKDHHQLDTGGIYRARRS